MKKAIIFDLDGVLVDSQPLHFEVDILTLRQLGIDANLEFVQKYAGMASVDRWKKYKHDLGLPDDPLALQKSCAKVLGKALSESELSPTENSEELLRFLKEKGLSLSVASSSSVEFVNNMLAKLNFSGYFDFIISGENLECSKPAPDIFFLAAKTHGLDVSECAVIEDSENGAAAANAANIFCVGYSNPSSGSQNLGIADIVITDFMELIKNDSWLD